MKWRRRMNMFQHRLFRETVVRIDSFLPNARSGLLSKLQWKPNSSTNGMKKLISINVASIFSWQHIVNKKCATLTFTVTLANAGHFNNLFTDEFRRNELQKNGIKVIISPQICWHYLMKTECPSIQLQSKVIIIKVVQSHLAQVNVYQKTWGYL